MFEKWKVKLFRTKPVNRDTLLDTKLKRCLNSVDITLFGIGHMIGAGVWVYTGVVAKERVGPGVSLSYALAGFAALLSAMCYAEFGSKIPKCGSAYNYTYAIWGELWAFIIGWNVLLEYLFSACSIAVSWSGSIDELSNFTISQALSFSFWPHFPGTKPYPDLVAVGITMVFVFVACLTVDTSIRLNNVLAVINVLGVVTVSCICYFVGSLDNWTNVPGGFLPYGVSVCASSPLGVFNGASLLFFSFIGFDAITTASEETVNPAKTIPRALFASVLVVIVVYCMAGSALTLMIPTGEILEKSPFSDALRRNHVYWAVPVSVVLSLIGMSTTLFGSIFSMPRIVMAFSNDGLLPSFLSAVNDKTQIPVRATILFGVISAIFALFLDLSTLAEVTAIGTLFAFTFIALQVIDLRYYEVESCPLESTADNDEDLKKVGKINDRFSCMKSWYLKLPTLRNFSSINIIRLHYIETLKASIVIGILIWNWENTWLFIALVTILVFFIIWPTLFILMHNRNDYVQPYRVPLVPIIPIFSVIVNVAMITDMNWITWVRLFVWIVIGLVIYFAYGCRHSKLGNEEPVGEYTELTAGTNVADNNNKTEQSY